MRFLEFLIDKSKIILIILLVLGLVNVVLGKPKWQFYSLYLLIIGYIIIVFLEYFKWLNLTPNKSKWIIVIGLFLLIIPFVFSLIFPSEKLPVPSGKFEIGSRIYDLEDISRNELYSDNVNENRKIKYQVWYPTDITSGYKKAKWISDGTILTRQLASNMNLPAFMLNHTAKIDSNSYLNAPVSESLSDYPVVIISHGWKGFREIHTDYAEELASNGFIAISVDHTYGSQMVRFKDGEVAYLNKEALPRFTLPSQLNGFSSVLATTYGQDVKAVIDNLEKLNNEDKHFQGKFDLDRLGLLGHSTGGGGIVYTSLKDERVKAVMGLDAWVNPLDAKDLSKGLKMPSLFLRSEQWSTGPNNGSLNKLIKNSQDTNLIQMYDTNHVDFSMSYMYSPLTKYIGFTGKLGGRKSSEIQREFILNFFLNHLSNKDMDDQYLEDIVEKYKEVEIVK